MQCSDCGVEIVEGKDEHACVYEDSEAGLVARFICIPCSNKPQYNDVTEEVTGRKPQHGS